MCHQRDSAQPSPMRLEVFAQEPWWNWRQQCQDQQELRPQSRYIWQGSHDKWMCWPVVKMCNTACNLSLELWRFTFNGRKSLFRNWKVPKKNHCLQQISHCSGHIIVCDSSSRRVKTFIDSKGCLFNRDSDAWQCFQKAAKVQTSTFQSTPLKSGTWQKSLEFWTYYTLTHFNFKIYLHLFAKTVEKPYVLLVSQKNLLIPRILPKVKTFS